MRSLAAGLLVFALSAFLLPPCCLARVIVYDAAVAAGLPVFLKIQTRGVFFIEGGRRAEVFVDGKTAGKILTGADGCGFIKLIPQAHGMKKIGVHSGADTGAGLLLVADKKDRVLLVEIDTALRPHPLAREPLKSSRETLQSLSARFRIIYLSGVLGVSIDRWWIGSARLPESVVLHWQGLQTLEGLRDGGLRLYAIVGTDRVLKGSETLVENRLGIETEESDIRSENWDRIREKLQ